MPKFGTSVASGLLVLCTSAAARDASEVHADSTAYAPTLQSAERFDSFAGFTGRWSSRLLTELDRSKLTVVTPRAADTDTDTEAASPLPPMVLTQPGPIDVRPDDAQWLGGARAARADVTEMASDTARDGLPDAGTAAPGASPGFNQKLGNWAILGIFIKFGVLPLLPAVAALAIGLAVRRRRRARALKGASVPASPVAHSTLWRGHESNDAPDDAVSNAAEVFDFSLDSVSPSAPTRHTPDATAIVDLKLRASDLGHRIADPEQRRRLALASSYLDLGHLTAARELIEDIERTDHDAWKLLFAGQSAAP